MTRSIAENLSDTLVQVERKNLLQSDERTDYSFSGLASS
jgi:hypothetical protein